MTNIVYNGQSISVTVPATQSIAISTEAGTYSARITAGVGVGTVLATNSAAGAIFGAYATSVVIQITASEFGIVSYDIGVTPVITHYPYARYSFDISGDVNGLISPSGSLVPVGLVSQSSEGVATPLLTATPATAGAPPFQEHINSFPNTGAGAGTRNHAVHMGFNSGRHSGGSGVVDGKAAILMGFEDNYYDWEGSLKYGPEWYVEYYSPNGTSQTMLRPFYCRIEGSDSNSSSNCTITHDIGSDGTGQFQVYAQGMGARTVLLNIASGGTTMAGTVTYTGLAVIPAIRGNTGANKDLYVQAGTSSGQIVFQNGASSANNLQIADNGTITTRDAATLDNFGSTGFKIGGSSTQKFGFYGATPVVRPTGTPANATDLATAITLVNSLKASLVSLGLIS